MRGSAELGALDRGTLALWRISNLVVWSIVGAVAAFVVYVSLVNLEWPTMLYWGSHFGGSTPGFLRIYDFAAAGACGAVVGAVVGARVYRTAGPVSGVLASLLMIVAPGRAHSVFVRDPAWFVGAIVLSGATAVVLARRAERRRPHALRGGHQ
jgi:lysylphosphatidylglycerol synthetase-like protein (DUF2156 family)